MPLFDSTLSTIPEPEARAAARCQAPLDAKTKPRGRLEELACRFAALTGRTDIPPPAR